MSNKGNAVANIDSSTSSKLALIYSRLAELEIQKEKRSNVWEDITRRFGPKDLDPIETANIETIFNDACQVYLNAAILLRGEGDSSGSAEKTPPSSSSTTSTAMAGMEEPSSLSPDSQVPDLTEAIHRIRMMFLAEEQFSESLHASFQSKIKKLTAFQSERDGYASEIYRIREVMMRVESRINDLEELCRNLQKLAKEKDEQRKHLIELERSKSEHLESECLQSINAVTKKIEQEEEELTQKEMENSNLKLRLEEFMHHISLQKERRQNELRAVELQKRLTEAKQAQELYLQEQEKMKKMAMKQRKKQLEETVTMLRKQLATYAEKFEEFEETLDRSTEVLEKIDERETHLLTILQKLTQEATTLKGKAQETDVAVIMNLESKRSLEQDLLGQKQIYEKLEKKCRKLLMKRQELIKSSERAAAMITNSATNSATSTASVNSLTPASSSSSSGAGSSNTVTSSSSTVISGIAIPSSSSSSSSNTTSTGRHRMKTPSPPLDYPSPLNNSTSSSSIVLTVPSSSSGGSYMMNSPNRRSHQVASSSSSSSSSSAYVVSSSSSPSRIQPPDDGLVGEGSPISSPNTTDRKTV
jgi:alkylhydroperoxidase/carboxymuconolactone decarboxylase family protein YurZ